ncbi:putative minus-end-directed kinesin ATPase [Helianthus anomalus]
MPPIVMLQLNMKLIDSSPKDIWRFIDNARTPIYFRSCSRCIIDIFELVGAPLVENCLAGFNTSIFAYGQTGRGKYYTIWGPTNTLLEENAYGKEQGLKSCEQNTHADKQLHISAVVRFSR